MTREIDRGTVVLAEEPYTSHNRRRPFVIISDDSYPFYPNGYLGVPLTRHDKENTFEITESVKEAVFEPFEKDDNYVNPYSPVQVNVPGRSLCTLSDEFMDALGYVVKDAIGLS